MNEQVSRETGGFLDPGFRYRWVTDRGLRLFTGAATLGTHQALLRHKVPEIEDLVPADDSLLVVLTAGADFPAKLGEIIKRVSGEDVAGRERREHSVPLYFDGQDLPAVAEQAGMSLGQLVEHMLGLSLTVRFLGFQPGFAYLSGLPAALCLPRRASPRKRVAAGSVGLGGGYCGIYPSSGSGGWHLVARTDWHLFDPQANPPARFQPGDVVRFVAA